MDSRAAHGTVFLVDDDEGMLRLIEKALRRAGCTTATASSGKAAGSWLAQNRADLMLLDLKLQDVEGKQLIEQLKRSGRSVPFIIITGQGDERVAVEMMKSGAMDYLVKDVDFLQFLPEVVHRALEQIETARRLAEAEEQVRLVRSVVDQGFSCVLITTAELPEPRIVYINSAFAQATGYTADKVIGQPLSTLSTLTGLQQRLRVGMPAGVSFVEEISTYQTAQGERWGEWRVGPVKNSQGRNTHWLVIFRDITERRHLEKEILEISDQERRRIGQDLHDGLCQHLAGIELMSQVLEQQLSGRSRTAATRAGEIARHVREAISQTRLLARGLSPVTLESEGLMSALVELAVGTEKLFGVTCRLVCEHRVPVYEPAVANHLYRIAQEAVSNAIKHGKAKKVVIRLDTFADRSVLSVSDNGRGFPSSPPKSPGMGLHIMRYRATMIGGSLAIEKNSEGGTTVTCSVPAARSV